MKLLQNKKYWRKGLLHEEKSRKIICKNITEYVIYEELFMAIMADQNYDRKKIIADSSSTSHMLNLEGNMTSLKDSKTWVTVWDSRTLTGGGYRNWHGCQKCDKKLHNVTLSIHT